VKRAALALVALGLLACALGHAQEGPRQGHAIAAVESASPTDRIVLVTGALSGNLEPCHCSEGMLGGLPRRASLVARLGGALPLLELGDLDRPSETTEALMEARERGALEALATMGAPLHVLALGCTDARLGLARLEALTNEVAPGLVWLCTNVKGGPAFLKPSVELEPAGEEPPVLVAAVLDPALVGTLDKGELTSPREAIAPLAARKKALVVLFHGEPAAAERALGDLAGISAIVCGHGDPAPTRRLASGAALLVPEANGQLLHALAFGKNGALHAEAAHALDGLLPDAQTTREALDRFYTKATEVQPEFPRQKVEVEGGKFVGSKECRDCHKEAYEVFEKSGHARALAKLQEKEAKRSGLSECLVCHVTGYGFETGWSARAPSPGLGAVGCESCHGVGSNHVERAYASGDDPAHRGDVLGYGRPPGKGPERWRARCMLCHDPANSPAFDLGPYLQKIRHWAKDL
jgi:hypothetical protein